MHTYIHYQGQDLIIHHKERKKDFLYISLPPEASYTGRYDLFSDDIYITGISMISLA